MPSERVVFLVHPKGVVVRKQGGKPSLPSEDELAPLSLDLSAGHQLDAQDSALALPIDPKLELPAPFAVAGLRELLALGEETFMRAGRASQIVEWAQTHKFCGRCATVTERVTDERCMRCPACGLLAYPVISPAMIVLVRRGKEALLARGSRFPGAFYSALAGFVEVGESLEQTVTREVREEVGIEVKDLRYFGSQPWPFPHSLMLAFTAEWAGGELKPDAKEILDARWCTPDDLPPIPPGISIARALIDQWLAGSR